MLYFPVGLALSNNRDSALGAYWDNLTAPATSSLLGLRQLIPSSSWSVTQLLIYLIPMAVRSAAFPPLSDVSYSFKMNKRIRSQPEGDSNNICKLPGSLIGVILSQLPIKDAVKTSILSREWRYNWTALPELCFDDGEFKPRSYSGNVSRVRHRQWVQMIDQILLFHTGSVRKFELIQRKIPHGGEIILWISFLSRITVKELILNLSTATNCKLPTTLFSCQSLTHLTLHHCEIKLPSTFDGFGNLKILKLKYVNVAQDDLEKLISCCCLLEQMTLYHSVALKLRINAPKLYRISLQGHFRGLCFGSNLLEEVDFRFSVDIQDEQLWGSQRHNPDFLSFFDCLPHLEILSVALYSLKYWSVPEVPAKLPRPCMLLRMLAIEIDFDSVKEISTTLCLLRSSPNLEGVWFGARSGGQTTTNAICDFWESNPSPCNLSKLNFASFTGIQCSVLEMGFIKFILSESPILERMEVEAAQDTGCVELLAELLSFERASPRAEVVYLG